jgi:hypothetical protein
LIFAEAETSMEFLASTTAREDFKFDRATIQKFVFLSI